MSNSPGACWDLVCSGQLVEEASGERFGPGSELGEYRPYAEAKCGIFQADEWCTVLRFPSVFVSNLIQAIPQLNYTLRKYRGADPDGAVDWTVGPVPTAKPFWVPRVTGWTF